MVKLMRQGTLRRIATVFLLALLILSLLGNAALLMRSWWTNQEWETEAVGMASYAGAMQALADFHDGVLRQYELSEGDETGYTQRNDGPFEIWHWPYHPSLGHGHVFSSQRFVEMYNSKMRYMHEHPDGFNFNGNGAHRETTQPATDR
jgi:hypothetical protein